MRPYPTIKIWSQKLRPGYLALFFMIAMIALPVLCEAQKVVQIERYGRSKTVKYGVGDELTYSLKSAPREFYTSTIMDLYPDLQSILFDSGGAVEVDQIAAFRYPRSNRWAKNLAATLFGFSVTSIFYSILDTLINKRAPSPFQYQAVGGSAALGTILYFLVPVRVDHFGERRRLRVLDLTFYPIDRP
jgi:hypothetical protein